MRKIFPAFIALLLLAVFSGAAHSQSPAAGTYINSEDSKEYLTLYPNGTFFLKQRKVPQNLEHPFEDLTGTYKMNGDAITLELGDGGEAEGKIKNNVFEDGQGKPWVKQGTAKPAAKPSK